MGIFDKFKKKKEKVDYIDEIITKLDCDCSIIEEDDVKRVMTRYHQVSHRGKKRRIYTTYHYPFRDDVRNR